MNNDERKIFWDTLCSLKENDGSLLNVIKYPKYLYRYRSLSLKSLSDLKNNKLSFSTSNYYDDPFDTYLKINKEKLKKDIDKIFSQKDINKNIKYFFNKIGIDIEEDEISKKMADLDLDAFYQKIIELMNKNSRNILRSYTLSVCFSENGFNESLWIKYANNHKGFAIIYDPYDESKFLCGKKDKCNKCPLKNHTASLYPIYYSDEAYDATEYAKWFTASWILKIITSGNIQNEIISSVFPQMNWEKEKIALIKKNCHMYDQEWRMISSIWNNVPINIEWKPYGVLLGLNMSQEDKDLVYNNAKIAGIENVFECYIDDEDELNYKKYELNEQK